MYQLPHNPQDGYISRIDAGKEFEVTYWSRKFGITKAALREVIAQVGDRTQEVREAVTRQGHASA